MEEVRIVYIQTPPAGTDASVAALAAAYPLMRAAAYYEEEVNAALDSDSAEGDSSGDGGGTEPA